MPKIYTSPFTQDSRLEMISFSNSDGILQSNFALSPNNTKLFITAGPDGSIVKSIILNNSDASQTRTISFFLSKDSGATKYLISTTQALASAGSIATLGPATVLGSATTAGIQGMPTDQTGMPVIYLGPGDSIYACVGFVAPQASTNAYLIALIEDF